MTDDEARRAEVVDELLRAVQRTAQPDLVAQLGERVPVAALGGPPRPDPCDSLAMLERSDVALVHAGMAIPDEGMREQKP